MRRYLVTILICFVCLFSFQKAKALSCDYDELLELNKDASAVKVNFEEKKELDTSDENENVEPAYILSFNVNVINITDKIYVTVYNSNDKSTKTFNSYNTNGGMASYNWSNIESSAELTIKIYSSDKTTCPNKELLTLTKILPMYNVYSASPFCETHGEEKVCQKYVTAKIGNAEYEKVVNKYQKQENEEFEKLQSKSKNGLMNFIKKNKMIIIVVGSTLVIIGVVTYVVIIKKKRSRSI